MINQSRRALLKGLGIGGIAISTGFSASAVMAYSKSASEVSTSASPLPTCDITIYQQQTSGKEIVTLMNLTDEAITLDSITPVGLEHVNGSLVVNVNNAPNGKVTLASGERLSFEVEAVTANLISEQDPIPNVLAGHLQIISDHPAFNGIIPVTVFDSQLA